ncbi:MAG: hypothetical protein ACU0A6_13925 [Shimia sp.]|jgi:hypothetical protein|uniref:hypothetical protein n=1 Tax=Shimia sp. TaxID=1954381 RepID=UPI004057E685
MRQGNLYVLTLCAALMAAPVIGQEAPLDGETEDGNSLIEEGARLFLKGLQQEMAPALEGFRDLAGEIGPQMQDFMMQMGPAMAEIVDKVEDWSSYHAPEMLENGDIILRKKTPEEMDLPESIDGEGDIEI